MTFPNYIDKYSSKPVFSPEDAEQYRRNAGKSTEMIVPDGLIIYYSRYIDQYIERNYTVTKQKSFYGSSFSLLDDYDHKIGLVGNFGFGAPVTIALLEEFIPLGIIYFISIGIAGTLQKDIKAGDIIVCDRAIRDEGTSHHYVESSKYAYASPVITKAIQNTLDNKKANYFTGTTWTTDAPNQETVAEVKYYQQEGVLAVDMEASALFAVSEFRRVNMGSLFTVSDSLAELEWKPEFHAEDTMKGQETILNVSIEALSGMLS